MNAKIDSGFSLDSHFANTYGAIKSNFREIHIFNFRFFILIILVRNFGGGGNIFIFIYSDGFGITKIVA